MTEHRNDETTGTGRTDVPEGHGDKPSNPEDARWQQRPDMGGTSGGQGGQGQTYGQGGQGREGLGQEGPGSTWRNDDDESDEGEKTPQEQGTGTPR